MWSKNTTFSVIKRLSERGVVKNEDTIVTSLISKDEAQLAKLDSVIDGRFSGSIPSFLAAFAKRQKLSEKDMVEIEKLLNGGDE